MGEGLELSCCCPYDRGSVNESSRRPSEPVAYGIVVYRQTDEELADFRRKLDLLEGQKRLYVACNMPGRDLVEVLGDAVHLGTASNLGFCGGANLAARAAARDGYRHFLLLNTDVELLVSDLAERLLWALDEQGHGGFVSPGIVLSSDHSITCYRGGRILGPAWLTRFPTMGREWAYPGRGVIETELFSGCCVLIDLEAFWSVGGFDENLFMYYDEADLAFRAAAAGFRSYLLDEPLVAHVKLGSRLSELEAFFFARNAALLLRRNARGWRRCLGRLCQFAAGPVFLGRCESRAARSAYLAGSRRRPRMPSGLAAALCPESRSPAPPIPQRQH
jgi:GT2 family glycosyltransferase